MLKKSGNASSAAASRNIAKRQVATEASPDHNYAANALVIVQNDKKEADGRSSVSQGQVSNVERLTESLRKYQEKLARL